MPTDLTLEQATPELPPAIGPGPSPFWPRHLVAYESESAFSIFVLFMVFWSLFTTYKGAMALFQSSRRRARPWFVALPALFYFVLMGGGALLYSAAG